jgi:hypothetical protein
VVDEALDLLRGEASEADAPDLGQDVVGDDLLVAPERGGRSVGPALSSSQTVRNSATVCCSDGRARPSAVAFRASVSLAAASARVLV